MAGEQSGTANTDTGEIPGELRRSITPTLLYFFVLGDILGAGIYALVGEVGGEVGGAIWTALYGGQRATERQKRGPLHVVVSFRSDHDVGRTSPHPAGVRPARSRRKQVAEDSSGAGFRRPTPMKRGLELPASPGRR